MALPVPDPPLGDGVVVLRPPDERDLAAIELGVRVERLLAACGRAGRLSP